MRDGAKRQRLQFNPGELEAVERRDNVTGIAAVIDDLKKRTREDRLRVWLALGGTEDDSPELSREAMVAMSRRYARRGTE